MIDDVYNVGILSVELGMQHADDNHRVKIRAEENIPGQKRSSCLFWFASQVVMK